MGLINNEEYYIKKLENVKVLETNNYKDLENKQKEYKERLEFYKAQRDITNTKIRMLEVYQELWENVDSEISKQAFLNEEFWNNINFNIIKYKKFVQELSDLDYDSKVKLGLDKKSDKEIWEKRQETFIATRNDIAYMNNNFNKMHSDIHKHTLMQRECIERHILYMESKYKSLETDMSKYRKIFHEIQRDIGSKGNKMSRQRLENYKISLIRKLEEINSYNQANGLDIAW
ncbi:MAG: hypothetical protein GX366_01355 [Epulopiscium sp.]|nr:hypothetical protein [Candidatus Epulonipiscium sp.]